LIPKFHLRRRPECVHIAIISALPNQTTDMPIVYIVRHGRAAASFTDDLDPGLDELGQKQAEAACKILRTHTPLELRSSPLKRALETARPLGVALNREVTLEARFAEIPSPGMSLSERGPWLRGVMQGRWSEQSADLQRWRQDLIDCLLEIRADTAIFSHFVAINAAVGAAEGEDRVVLFRPNNGSITSIEIDDGRLAVLSRGDEAETRIN
jgi:broad specificity phosphatase PhoE